MRTISTLRKDLTEYKQQRYAEHNANIIIDDCNMRIYTPDQEKIYAPSNTGRSFHIDNSFVRLIVGPYGSGKTTTAITEIVRRACEMPVWTCNRRRSRWAVVRNTSGELQTTTLASWLAWFGDLGDIHKRQKPIMNYEHTFNDGKGIVELELIFIALDRPEDVRKIKSLELTGCYLNELSEIPQEALAHMTGRVNRYPSKAFCSAPYWSGIIADSNPIETDHWMYKKFVEQNIPDYRLFRQPPGLIKNEDDKLVRNPDADNAKNLPGDYYEKLALGQTKEFINVFCLGEWGTVSFNKIVYTEFNSDLHAVDHIEPLQGEPLYLGVDFGLTPAVVVVQFTARGQILVLKEYCGKDIGIKGFMDSVVLPSIKRDFIYNRIADVIADPSGVSRDAILEEMSCIGELINMGLNARGAKSNDEEPRIAGVRYFLNKMTDGKPAFLLSRRDCPVLFKGFLKDYYFKRIAVPGEERYRDKPEKNMSSHPHDALQYVCMEFATMNIIKEKAQDEPVNMFNPGFQWRN